MSDIWNQLGQEEKEPTQLRRVGMAWEECSGQG